MRIARFERVDLIAIAVGGLIGATVRWLLTDATAPNEPGQASGGWFTTAPETPLPDPTIDVFTFPWRTLMVNLIGCVLLGAIFTFRKQALGNTRIMLATALGFCGSLTTFSAFAVEVAERIRFDGSLPIPDFPFESSPSFSVSNAGLSPLLEGLVYLAVSVVGAGFAFNMGRQAATRNDA